ncbi:SDR family oxidoreductase [Ottowia testudinis]|uniref:SDR family oxidoreductase n=1 Tax=Ottowia testudinis TaxID=2816950 RepID=A0A975H3J1_9BURK|nr:SDR family oxidoreductase [Ottowia testudinis]QTD45330.1 SDR family oxidoreductase [Ottowia testudinis]
MATLLIIGASRGIGWELARQSVAAGDRVIATARDAAGLAALRDLGCQALQLDVADAASVSGLAWQLDGEKIDTAWHVAGVMCNRADATQPPTQADFDRVMHTNVLGAMQVITQVAPLVQAAGGRFAFLSSAMGQIGTVSGSGAWLYRVSKAALNMAVAAARHSYPGVIFTVFHPGWVRTDMGGAGAPVTPEQSAAGLRATLAAATAADNGAFMQFDGSRLNGW